MPHQNSQMRRQMAALDRLGRKEELPKLPIEPGPATVIHVPLLPLKTVEEHHLTWQVPESIFEESATRMFTVAIDGDAVGSASCS